MSRLKTPMEQDYPTLCEWVRHGCVNTDHLEKELRAALAWVSDRDVVLLPKTFARTLVAEGD